MSKEWWSICSLIQDIGVPTDIMWNILGWQCDIELASFYYPREWSPSSEWYAAGIFKQWKQFKFKYRWCLKLFKKSMLGLKCQLRQRGYDKCANHVRRNLSGVGALKKPPVFVYCSKGAISQSEFIGRIKRYCSAPQTIHKKNWGAWDSINGREQV